MVFENRVLRRIFGPKMEKVTGDWRMLYNEETHIGFEVFTSVVMKTIIFWDVTPHSPLSVNRRFGGTYRLNLQGRRNKFSKNPARKQV
jgi:hypothetical protein